MAASLYQGILTIPSAQVPKFLRIYRDIWLKFRSVSDKISLSRIISDSDSETESENSTTPKESDQRKVSLDCETLTKSVNFNI